MCLQLTVSKKYIFYSVLCLQGLALVMHSDKFISLVPFIIIIIINEFHRDASLTKTSGPPLSYARYFHAEFTRYTC